MLPEDWEGDEATWYEEEAWLRTLADKNGTVVCEYMEHNHNVVSVKYTPKDGTVLPITVFTYDELQKAQHKVAMRHMLFDVRYCIEFLAVLLVYWKKRAK